MCATHFRWLLHSWQHHHRPTIRVLAMHLNTCNMEAKGRACRMRSAADVCRLHGVRELHASEPRSPLTSYPSDRGAGASFDFQHVKLASISVSKSTQSGGGLVRDIHPKPHGSHSLLDSHTPVLCLTICSSD